MLEIAESRRVAAGVENFEFVQADVQSLEWSEPFDAIVARLLLFHLPDREAVLRRQLDALRPGGTMVVAEFDCQGEWLGAIRVRRQRSCEPPLPKRTEGRRKPPGYFQVTRPDELSHLDMTSV